MGNSTAEVANKNISHKVSPSIAESYLVKLLEQADIRINGDRPWDIQIHNNAVFSRILASGTHLAFAESYMQSWWDTQNLDELIARVLSARLDKQIPKLGRLQLLKALCSAALLNKQNPDRAFEVGKAHYDIGNDLYQKMLDPRMIYSCGYWPGAQTLAQAQEQKLDLICRKLELAPGMQLLDIGCGWGGLAEFAAQRYGVEVVGITISREQKKLAQERCAGLPVDIRLVDYRALQGRFDRIVSVGMFEHVGKKNHRVYFETVRRLLAPDGLFLLHSIGADKARHGVDPFIEKYIFPNGEIPSRHSVNHSSLGLLRLEDWHNFGPDYDRTLMAWWHNFDRAWPELKERYDQDHFYRMWKYYLLSSAGYFRSRGGQLWQMVFSHLDSDREYRSLR